MNTQEFIEAHREEIERAARDKETVIAYITTEGNKSFLNVLDFDGEGGKFHKFPVNETALMRLNAEAANTVYLGRPKVENWGG